MFLDIQNLNYYSKNYIFPFFFIFINPYLLNKLLSITYNIDFEKRAI